MIPMFDAKRQVEVLGDALTDAACEVIRGGWYVLGKHLEAFEQQFATFAGDGFAAGVANGTDAIKLALLAAGIKPGDEVIVPANTAIPTAMAVSDTGAVPVFCDVDQFTLLLDLDMAKSLCTPKTKAMVPVHLYGQALDLTLIMSFAEKMGIAIIEDCAQAQGAKVAGTHVGLFGKAGAFSFYPSKNLGGIGDAGLVLSANPETADRIKLLRNYGQPDRYRATVIGINSRMDDIQAAMLSVKLAHLGKWNHRRREIAKRYIEMLRETELVLPRFGEGDVFHLFVVRTEKRDALQKYLAEKGVSSQVHYPIPLHLQPAYANLENKQGALPVSEKAAMQILSLPLFPELTDNEVRQVGESVRGFFGV